MSEPTLDWSTAKVKDSKLTVQVEGDIPKGWRATFNTTVQLLGGGSWGDVKLRRGNKAEVGEAAPGTEENIKHFLEGVVQQANATHELSDEDEHDEDEHDDRAGADEQDDNDSDSEMSNRFRSFAKSDGD